MSSTDLRPAEGRDERDRPAPSPLLQISNAMVRHYEDTFGRGLTKAKGD